MKDQVEENIQAEHQKEKRMLINEKSLRNLWDKMKHNNIHIMGIPEGEESEQRIKNLFEEIMTEKFPNLVNEKDTQVQETQSPKQVGPKETYPKTYHKQTGKA